MPNVTLEDFANTRQKLSYCFPQKAITSTNKMKNVTPLDIPNSQFYMRARPLEGHRSILMMSLHMAATVLPCTGIEQLFCWSICPVVITAPGLTLANTHRYCGSQKKPGVLNIKKKTTTILMLTPWIPCLLIMSISTWVRSEIDFLLAFEPFILASCKVPNGWLRLKLF